MIPVELRPGHRVSAGLLGAGLLGAGLVGAGLVVRVGRMMGGAGGSGGG